MNAAAMIPDLVFWIDYPEKSDETHQIWNIADDKPKQEYFETQEIQTSIRQGFHELFGATTCTRPFNQCHVVGPIMNEGGIDELKTELRTQLRRFFNKKPEPLNVDRDEVDRSLLNKLVHDVKKQRRLPGAPQERTAIHVGWLGEKSPAQWMEDAENNWPIASAQENDVPASPLAHLLVHPWYTLVDGRIQRSAPASRLPRTGSDGYSTSHAAIDQMVATENWIHKQQHHTPFADAQLFKLREERLGFARLTLAMWPLRPHLASWRRANPDEPWEGGVELLVCR